MCTKYGFFNFENMYTDSAEITSFNENRYKVNDHDITKIASTLYNSNLNNSTTITKQGNI